jgi:hypothetical protein
VISSSDVEEGRNEKCRRWGIGDIFLFLFEEEKKASAIVG